MTKRKKVWYIKTGAVKEMGFFMANLRIKNMRNIIIKSRKLLFPISPAISFYIPLFFGGRNVRCSMDKNCN